MKINSYMKNKVGVLELFGTLNAHTASELEHEFRSLLRQEVRQFVFDLSGLTMLDSTGLGMMIRCLRQALDKGGEIKLANIQDKPRLVFEMTRTYQLFGFYDHLENCLQSFQEVGV